MNTALPEKIRTLVIVLGDQLDMESAALRGLDPEKDVIWMAEVAGESTYVWSSKGDVPNLVKTRGGIVIG